jgi:DNA-binding transcriptional MerR regulator
VQSFSTIGLALALVFLSVGPAFAQVAEDLLYRERVEYQDGKLSVDFDQTPLEVALDAIQVKAGVQIIIPSVTEQKLLNLRLSQLPLEPAVRFLIASIGFKSFALMYDEQGLPRRAVVLAARPEARMAPLADTKVDLSSVEAPSENLTPEERTQLQQELERWGELKQEDRSRIEHRLKNLSPSEDREQLLKEYARQLLGIKK